MKIKDHIKELKGLGDTQGLDELKKGIENNIEHYKDRIQNVIDANYKKRFEKILKDNEEILELIEK